MTHMMSMVDLVTISVETLMIDNGCSLKNEFTELICINPRMVLYLNINWVNSCHFVLRLETLTTSYECIIMF